MATITVSYLELDGSGKGAYDRDGGSAMWRLLCDYTDADQLCQEAMGAVVTAGQGSQIRSAPLQHPRRPHLYCRQAAYDGYGVATIDTRDGLAKYTKAIVTLIFQPLERPESDQNGDNPVYLTEVREPQVSMLTIPPGENAEGLLFWEEGPRDGFGVSDSQTTTIRQCLTKVRISINKWIGHDPSDPNDPFTTFAGTVNDRDITFLWQRWPKWTLLYEGGPLSRDYLQDSVSAWKLDMSFVYNPKTWMKLPYSDGRWYLATSGEGKNLYEESDFSRLLPR